MMVFATTAAGGCSPRRRPTRHTLNHRTWSTTGARRVASATAPGHLLCCLVVRSLEAVPDEGISMVVPHDMRDPGSAVRSSVNKRRQLWIYGAVK